MHEEPLLPWLAIRALGHTDERHVAEAECLELLVYLVDLSQSAIDQQQVRCRYLTILDAHIAPFERLSKCAIVITRCHARDVESPVFLLERSLGAEDHAGCNCPLAARVADVEALDAGRNLGKIELSGEGRKHFIHALFLRQAHSQCLSGILLRQLDILDAKTTHRTAYVHVPRNA